MPFAHFTVQHAMLLHINVCLWFSILPQLLSCIKKHCKVTYTVQQQMTLVEPGDGNNHQFKKLNKGLNFCKQHSKNLLTVNGIIISIYFSQQLMIYLTI